ncbi:hypothetical protein L5515_005847 [Caenorhabditis briggsae]|uniref:F-box domain-containing protein n=1 Tax=Caenorhabditis briggsae TaxID=6238 RepID=A0AAE9JHY9_CAEBR|nr:hypothetical protein L5515_005847 [Caenorhabditis briggsae]
MPINLLKLPCLVGAMVVTELDYQKIFLLSLCSRRTLFLAKKARITVPKLTLHSEKCDTFVIGVKIDMMEWFYVTSVKHVPKLNLEGVLNANPVLGYGADTKCVLVIFLAIKTQVTTKNIVSWYEDDPDYGEEDPGHGTSFRHRIECASKPMIVQKEYQNHINSIFHYSCTYELYLSTKRKGQLPNITNNFVGRNMFLERVTVTEQDFIQFIQKWISNEAYHNLETLFIIVAYPLSINADLIRQIIEFEEFDPNEPEKRPEHFVMDAPYVF